MKIFRLSDHFTPLSDAGLCTAGALVLLTMLQSVGAAEERRATAALPTAPPQTSSTDPSTADSRDSASAPDEHATAKLSPGVQDILKMTLAGVSKEVIRVYVENSVPGDPPTPADLIALKERGIPDDITMALLKRNSAVRAQANQRKATTAAPMVRTAAPAQTFLDPEGYDYFRYYYLYPRTLASVYQQLPPYPAPFYYGPNYSFGYPYRR